MKTHILSIICISAFFCSFTSDLYAWDQLPIPGIYSPIGTSYITVDGYVYFDGTDSYDPDNEYGSGIVQYGWEVMDFYTYQFVDFQYSSSPYYCFDPYEIEVGPGVYDVRLWVKDDEGNWSEIYAAQLVVVFYVEITEPSSYPAIIALGDSLDLNCYSNQGGGTYDWSKVSGPGDATFTPSNEVSNPDFSATEPGDYTVEVEYTVQGATDSNESGLIMVVGVGEIEIEKYPSTWETVTGQTIVVLKGSIYNFKALPNPSYAGWPDYKPEWTFASSSIGSPGDETVEVTFSSTGNYTLTATCGTSSKHVTIHVVAPIVYQFGFDGDNLLYQTPSTYNGWGDGTVQITDPVYDSSATPAKNDPVCVTRNSSSVSLTNVKLKVSEALSYITTIGIDAGWTEQWDDVNGISFSGTTSQEASLNISGTIINQVTTYNGDFKISWWYSVPAPGGNGTWYPTNNTSHTVYVTWGQPSGSSVTEKRIEFVCNAADGIGGTNPTVPANAIFNNLSGSFDLSGPPWGPVPIWRLHNSGEISQCPGIARYVNSHFQMLGLTDTEVIRYCHATSSGTYIASSTDPGTIWRSIALDVNHPMPTTHDDYYASERLAHIDGNGNPNAYEATCLFNGYHYALGVGIFTTAEDVVEAAFTSVEWQYRVGSNPPYTFLTCTEDPWVEAP
ncbi:MAG: hypothetical protein A2173_10960 [Planctomycetes bacterium RBG_13_44_8b]|nr:MAG: hypothetical protein A2173_10960 [Planctomycetes bacterium RBG_13_44_8b]